MKIFVPALIAALLVFAVSCGNLPVENPSAQAGGNPDVKKVKEELPPLTDAEKRVLERLGGEVLPDQNLKIGNITIHRKEKEISFSGKVNLTSGDLEVLISMPHGRVHESLLSSRADPMKLQLALLLLGAENGSRKGGEKIRQGSLMDIFVQPDGGKRVHVEDWLLNKKTSKGLEKAGWVFVGSSFAGNMVCLAKEEGNIVNLWSFGNTILDNPASTGDEDDFVIVNPDTVAPYETPVTIFLAFRKPPK